MAVSSVTVEIKDQEYAITPFTAVKGLKLFKRVMTIAGPGLEHLGDEEGDITNVIAAVIKKFDEEPVEVLIQDLVKGVLCDNQEIIFATHFQANYGTLFKLVAEVIKVNFGNVFTEGGLVDLEDLGLTSQ